MTVSKGVESATAAAEREEEEAEGSREEDAGSEETTAEGGGRVAVEGTDVKVVALVAPPSGERIETTLLGCLAARVASLSALAATS